MGYVDVAGHRTWHEVSGSGPPVVLLHGAFAGLLDGHRLLDGHHLIGAD